MSYDIVCFCHLRWNFVYQRPQQLMSRLAAKHRVFFVEEPVFDNQGARAYVEVDTTAENNVYVVTPHLAGDMTDRGIADELAGLLTGLFGEYHIER